MKKARVSLARDITIRSTKAILELASVPEELGPWKSKLLWASRVLPMPLVGLLIIGSVCDVGNEESEYPDLEALSRLDFGAAMKMFLAKRLTSEFTQVTPDLEAGLVIIANDSLVIGMTISLADMDIRPIPAIVGGYYPHIVGIL